MKNQLGKRAARREKVVLDALYRNERLARHEFIFKIGYTQSTIDDLIADGLIQEFKSWDRDHPSDMPARRLEYALTEKGVKFVESYKKPNHR